MRLVVILAILSATVSLRAQDTSLADADMDFTRDILQHYHFAARVSLETKKDQYTNFQYDHYPQDGPYHGAERVKADEGTFSRRPGGAWLKSDDWGQTGAPADTSLVQELNTYVTIATLPFEKPKNLDASQGKNVWKYIGKTEKDGISYFTYERTREHPHSGGVYPRYAFMKAAGDTDGQLFCVMTTGQLRSGADHIPYTLHLIYMIPIPPGTQVKVFDKDTNKEKLQTITEKDSGWEITTPRSAPPSAASPVHLNVNAKVEDLTPSTNAAP